MKTDSVPFWRTQTTRLAATYLAIIMAMSLGFSTILYGVSAAQLDSQLPNTPYADERGTFVPEPRLRRFIAGKVDESKRELLIRLGVLNAVMLVFGVAVSYLLARKTLEPIERSSEAQSQFVSDVSHELRTPLTAIQTSNEVALRKKKLTLAEAREIISSNTTDVQRLQRMTTLLLELVRDNAALNRQSVAVHDIVARAMTIVAPSAVQREIVMDDQTKNVRLDADADAITEALVVLLDNAIKYSEPGGTVTLTTKQHRQTAVLAVADTGQGITEADQTKIFQRFYRSDTARLRQDSGGYGLGLAIAKKIVEAHDGHIEVKSRPGKGSVFSLIIPRAK